MEYIQRFGVWGFQPWRQVVSLLTTSIKADPISPPPPPSLHPTDVSWKVPLPPSKFLSPYSSPHTQYLVSTCGAHLWLNQYFDVGIMWCPVWSDWVGEGGREGGKEGGREGERGEERGEREGEEGGREGGREGEGGRERGGGRKWQIRAVITDCLVSFQ